MTQRYFETDVYFLYIYIVKQGWKFAINGVFLYFNAVVMLPNYLMILVLFYMKVHREIFGLNYVSHRKKIPFINDYHSLLLFRIYSIELQLAQWTIFMTDYKYCPCTRMYTLHSRLVRRSLHYLKPCICITLLT